MTDDDPLRAARDIMKQQALDAGQPIIERWHDHPSLDICGPSCPAPGTGWDGSHLVIDHFPRTGGDSRE